MEPYDWDDSGSAGPNREKVRFGPFSTPLDRDRTTSKRRSVGSIRLVSLRTMESKMPFTTVLGATGRSEKTTKNTDTLNAILRP